MRICVYIISVTLLVINSSCSISYFHFNSKSPTQQGKKQVKLEISQQSYDRGLNDGVNKGLEKGYLKSINSHKQIALSSIETDKKKYHRVVDMIISDGEQNLPHHDQERKNLYNTGYGAAIRDYKDLGFRHGYNYYYSNILFPSLLDSGRNTTINYSPIYDIDYESIVEAITSIKGEMYLVESKKFQNIIKEINYEILKYITLQCKLTDNQKQELYTEYNRHHEALAAIYYHTYVELYRTHLLHLSNGTVYSYDKPYMIEIFMDIVVAGVSSVLDITLTYVQKDGQYVVYQGLTVFGDVYKIIIDTLLKDCKRKMLEVALRSEYNIAQIHLRRNSEQVFEHTIIGTQTDTLPIIETKTEKDLDKDYVSAEIKMNILSTYNIALKNDEIEIKVDDREKIFIIIVPVKPRILNIVKQSSCLTSVKSEIEYVASYDIHKHKRDILTTFIKQDNRRPNPTSFNKTSVNKSKTVLLPHKTLNKVFEDNKPNFEQLEMRVKNLNCQYLYDILDIIKRTIEPATSIENSCYGAKVMFDDGSCETVLYETCK